MLVVFDIFVSLFENFILLSFPALFFKERKKYLKYVFTVIMTTASSQLDTLNYPFLMFAAIIILGIYCWMNLEEKVHITIYFCIFMFTILYFISMIAILVENIFVKELGNNLYADKGVYLICLVLGKIAFLLVYNFFRNHRHIMQDFLILKNHMYMFSFTEIVLFCLMSLFVTMILQQSLTISASIFMIILLSIIFLIFFYQYAALAKANKETNEEQMKRTALEYDKLYHKDLTTVYENNRALKHDMKNHLSVLQNMIRNHQEEEALNYLDEVHQKIDVTEFIHTSRSTLNYILNTKIALIKEQDIKMVVSIEDTLNFIDDVDLCVLIGNLLDNSLEAASKVEQAALELIISKTEHMTLIKITNSYDRTNIITEDQQFLTSKTDKEVHGFGLRNIKEVVEKYQGIMNISVEDQFQVSIAFEQEVDAFM